MTIYKSLIPEIKLVTEKTYNYVHKAKITSSQNVYEYIKPLWPVDINHREATMALFLNRANNTVGYSVLGIGGLSACVVDGKVLFQQALVSNASAIILAHNHPSGSLVASNSDITLTNNLKSFGNYIDLQVLDHLILGEDSFYSFADEGML